MSSGLLEYSAGMQDVLGRESYYFTHLGVCFVGDTGASGP